MLLFNHHDHIKILEKLCPTTFNHGVDQAITRVGKSGRFLGGVIISSYTGNGGSVLIHVASEDPRWLCRDLLWIVFDYAFVQLKCKRAFVQVHSNNHKSLHFTRRLGFKLVTVIPGAFPDGDMVIKQLEEHNCQWHHLKPRGIKRGDNGQ